MPDRGRNIVPVALKDAWPLQGGGLLLVVVASLFLAGLLMGNASTPLWDQDEAAYAGFARQMVEEGQWVAPSFPYSLPHRKPPLAFWAIAGSYSLFGINEFAVRLPSAICIVLTLACLWLGGGFILGREVARLAAVLLTSCTFVLTMGKIALTDGPLLLCQTVAALAMLRAVVRPSWKCTAVLWAAVAAGVLVKGQAILMLVACMFVVLAIFHPRRRNLIHLHPWIGLPLALVPMGVWVHYAWQADPWYVLFLLHWYVLRRVGGTVFGQGGPPGTYFLLLFVLLVPWTGYLLCALRDAVRGFRRRRSAFVFLAAWLAGGWLIWELPPSKLPTYVLGAFPALAILLARQVIANLRGRIRWEADAALRLGFGIMLVISVGVGIVLIVLGVLSGRWGSALLSLIPAAMVVLGSLGAIRFQKRHQPLGAFWVVLFGSLATNLAVWLFTIPGLQDRLGTRRQVADLTAQLCPPGTTVIVAKRMALPSLPFYLMQHSLKFRGAIERPTSDAPVHVDWSLLREFRFHEWAEQVSAVVEAERARPSKEETLDAVRGLLRSGQRCALILDDAQFEAVRGDVGEALVRRMEGWRPDKLERTAYVLVITSPKHSQPLEEPAPASRMADR